MTTLSPIRQAFLSWGIFILFECLLGMLRRSLLEPQFPLIATEVVGVVGGVFVACVIAYWFLHKGWFPADRRQLYIIGALWVAFTLAFEFLFGLFLGQKLSTLVEIFRIDQGRLFVLGLIALFFIPMAVAQRNEVID